MPDLRRINATRVPSREGTALTRVDPGGNPETVMLLSGPGASHTPSPLTGSHTQSPPEASKASHWVGLLIGSCDHVVVASIRALHTRPDASTPDSRPPVGLTTT